MEKNRKERPSKEAMLLRMAGLCARAEQCESDVRAKILRAGFSRGEADEMLDYLVGHKYIDNRRFARAFARDKVCFSGWGKLKIRQALRHKGISEDLTSEALEAVDPTDYLEALGKALGAKARCLDLKEVCDRRRLYRYLASKGFESSMIITSIREKLAAKDIQQ